MLSTVLLWIAVAMIIAGLLNLLFRMIMALIEDGEWGLLLIVTGLLAIGISYGVHIYSLGR